MTRACLGALLLAAVWGAARAEDVTYFDRKAKKEVDLAGAVVAQDGPAGLKLKVRKGKETEEKSIAADDIVQVVYTSKDVDKLSFRTPLGKEGQGRRSNSIKERAKYFQEALDGYTTLEGKMSDVPAAQRYLQYKIAEVTILMARDDPDDDKKMQQGIKLLTDFKKKHKDGWQIARALKLLARLQEEQGEADKARESYEELAELDGVPASVRQESQALVGRLLSRGGKYGDAHKRLKKLLGQLSPGDPQRPFVQAYLVEAGMGLNQYDDAVKVLNAVIKEGDGRARGVAYNLLGDYYLKKGDRDAAFWSFLRVDAQYNDDPEEQAKALYHLVTLFDKVKNQPARGKACQVRLMSKAYANTRYQKKGREDFKEGK